MAVLDIIINGQDQGATAVLTGVGGALSHIFEIAAGNIIASGVEGLLAKLGEIGPAALTAATDYETAMARIRGQTGMTGTDVAKLGAEGLALADKYGLTAKDVESAMGVIAGAQYRGADAAKILEVASKAAAGGYGTVSEIAAETSTVLKAYNLSADDASRITDVLAKSSTLSGKSMSEMSAALGPLLPLANQLGIPIEQLAGFMDTAAQKGMALGTSSMALRSILAELERPTKAQQAAFEVVGLSAENFKKEIQDKGLVAALANLQARTAAVGGTTIEVAAKHQEAASAVAAHALADTKLQEALDKAKAALADEERAITINSTQHYWNAVQLKQNEDRVTALHKTIENLTAQQGIHTLQAGELAAKYGDVNNTLETADDLFARILPSARSLGGILEVVNDKTGDSGRILGQLNNATGTTQTAWEAMSATFAVQQGRITAAIEHIGIDIMTKLLPAVTPFLNAFATDLPIAFDYLLPRLQAIGEELAANLSPALAWLAENGLPLLREGLQFVNDHLDAFKGALVGIGAVIAGGGILAIAAAIAGLVSPIGLVIAAAALLGAAWSQNWGDIQGKTKAAIDFIVPLVQGGLAMIQAFWAQHGNQIMSTVQNFMTSVQGAIAAALAFIQPLVSAALAAIAGWWSAHGAHVIAAVSALWAAVQSAVGAGLAFVQAIISAVLPVIQSTWAAWGGTLTANWNTAWTAIQDIVQRLVAIVAAIIDGFTALLQGNWSKLGEDLRIIWVQAWQIIGDIFSTALGNLIAIATNLAQQIGDAFTKVDWAALGHSIIDGIVAGIMAGIARAIAAIQDAAKQLLDAANAALHAKSPSLLFAEVGRNVMEGMALGIQQYTYAPQFALAAAIPPMAMVASQGATNAVQGPATGSGRSGNVTINFGDVHVTGPGDIDELAYKIATVLQRKQG
jgi:TP901 family phage tail tape measure protein